MDYKLILLLGGYFVITVFYLYYWWQAVSMAKNSNAFMFFNWFYLFMPDAFNDAGNYYRRKSLVCFILLFLDVAIMFILSE